MRRLNTTALRPPVRADAGGRLGAAVLVGSFAALTLLVLMRWPVHPVDVRLNAALPPSRSGPRALHEVAEGISFAAAPARTLAVTAGVAVAVALISRSLKPLACVMPALVTLIVTVAASKWIIGRHGPPGSSIQDGLGYYPSGHTATAVVCAGTLAVLLARRYPRHRRALLAVAAGWGVLVAWSMVWLHYHWVTDVLGGALLATWLLWLLYRWPAQLAGPVGRHDGAGRPVPRGPSLRERPGGR